MSEFSSSPRYETTAAIERVERLLNLSDEGGEPQQDWDLLAADPKRLDEFCDLYESEGLDDETKFALMCLTVASLDESLPAGEVPGSGSGPIQRVERLLRRDFTLHLHTIHYWALLEEADPDNVFAVTPLMRRVWSECFKPEYQPQLDADGG